MSAYRYCSQAMPAVGVYVLVWYSTEDVEAQWTGAQWLDRQGRRLKAGEVMCWRDK
jgi:hypothetical protein